MLIDELSARELLNDQAYCSPGLFSPSVIDEKRVNLLTWVLDQLDCGNIRVAQFENGEWKTNVWIKNAITLALVGKKSRFLQSDWGRGFDKIGSKFEKWRAEDFAGRNIRVVPGGYVRKGAFVGSNCILMPSFINIGAYVGSGTMIDTFSTVGSCAQIGSNVHISGGVGIGGVLEPANACPTIIEDNVFIGARSEIAEGVIVKKGSVVSMGCYIGASTKIVNRATGEVTYGSVPENAVVVPGSHRSSDDLSTYCVVIIKFADESTRSKTKLNELLRDSGV